jgi:hypothetical protein
MVSDELSGKNLPLLIFRLLAAMLSSIFGWLPEVRSKGIGWMMLRLEPVLARTEVSDRGDAAFRAMPAAGTKSRPLAGDGPPSS